MSTQQDGQHDSSGTPEDPSTREQVAETLRAAKPKLRGWFHAGWTPIAVAAGIVLVAVAPTGLGKISAAVFLVASLLLFGTSGIYHRFNWGPRGDAILRRIDHSNIYVFIAATYTPMACMMLTGRSRVILLVLIWSAALAGLAFRLLWLGAPRWLYTVLYLLMGWAAVGWLKPFYETGGMAVFVLICVGGLLYSAGAVVYGTKRPNPSPRWFGFHEIFHACTIAAFVAHYIAISMVIYRAA